MKEEKNYEINANGDLNIQVSNIYALMTMIASSEHTGKDGNFVINFKSDKPGLVMVPKKSFTNNLTIKAKGNVIIDGGNCDKVVVRNLTVSAANVEIRGGVFFENYKNN